MLLIQLNWLWMQISVFMFWTSFLGSVPMHDILLEECPEYPGHYVTFSLHILCDWSSIVPGLFVPPNSLCEVLQKFVFMHLDLFCWKDFGAIDEAIETCLSDHLLCRCSELQ